MAQKSINQVFAENLATLMKAKGFNQPGLAKASGVSQKTVSNYLDPKKRGTATKSGRESSAKLTELQMIADALQIDAWKLLWPLDEGERLAYESIEAAFRALHPKPPKPAVVVTNKEPKKANVAGK